MVWLRRRLTDTVRDTIGTATYFVAYESSKQLLTRFGGDGAHSNPLAVLAAGGFCGVVSWALICMISAPFPGPFPHRARL